jgi:hypothetical protein
MTFVGLHFVLVRDLGDSLAASQYDGGYLGFELRRVVLAESSAHLWYSFQQGPYPRRSEWRFNLCIVQFCGAISVDIYTETSGSSARTWASSLTKITNSFYSELNYLFSVRPWRYIERE